MLKVHGIHHVSSIVGHAQRNIDFYASVLGMRLVKKTINFDDSSTYHFYFGNHDASTPIFTTFPWNDATEGKNGSGYVNTTSLAINKDSFDFWQDRLDSFNIENYTYTRFNRRRIAFKDMDNLEIELVENDEIANSEWEYNGIVSEHAIKGIDSAILYSRTPHTTLALLTDILGFELIDEDEENYLLKSANGIGGTVELAKKYHTLGKQGVGTVHHIAFAIDDETGDAWVSKLENAGFRPTEVKDRKYFKSVYFREKGGILIELATFSPGMLVDESVENLGSTLLIPPHFESIEKEIKETVMPVEVREVNELIGYGYRDRYEFEILRKKEAIKREILKLKNLEKQRDLTLDENKELKDLKDSLRNVY